MSHKVKREPDIELVENVKIDLGSSQSSVCNEDFLPKEHWREDLATYDNDVTGQLMLMRQSNILNDCSIIDNTTTINPCHRVCLARISPVLESKLASESEIKLNLPTLSCQKFIKFAYTGTIPECDDIKEALGLYQVAKDLESDELLISCINSFGGFLNEKNVFKYYNSVSEQHDDLLIKCLEFICANIGSLLTKQPFVYKESDGQQVPLTRQKIRTILGDNNLQITDELPLIKAVEQWAEFCMKQKKKTLSWFREEVKHLIPNLRVLTVKEADMLEYLKSTKLFNDEEKKHIRLALKDKDHKGFPKTVCRIRDLREIVMNSPEHDVRLPQHDDSPHERIFCQNGDAASLRVKANQNLQLHSVSLHSQVDRGQSEKVSKLRRPSAQLSPEQSDAVPREASTSGSRKRNFSSDSQSGPSRKKADLPTSSSPDKLPHSTQQMIVTIDERQCDRSTFLQLYDNSEDREKVAAGDEFKNYQTKGKFIDCAFQVFEPETEYFKIIKAHRIIMSRIPSLLKQRVCEAPDALLICANRKIPMYTFRGFPVKDFHCIVNFIYLNRNKFNGIEDAVNVYKTARALRCISMVKTCITYMNTMVTPQFVWDCFSAADFMNDETLLRICLKVVTHQFRECMYTQNGELRSKFLNCSSEILSKICELSYLNVSSELEIVDVCEKWAVEQIKKSNLEHTECNVQKVLEDVIPHIRFLALTTDEFQECSKTPMLSQNDRLAVYDKLTMGSPGIHSKELSKAVCPEARKRFLSYDSHQRPWIYEFRRDKTQEPNPIFVVEPTSISMTFEIDDDVNLHSFSIHSQKKTKSKLNDHYEEDLVASVWKIEKLNLRGKERDAFVRKYPISMTKIWEDIVKGERTPYDSYFKIPFRPLLLNSSDKYVYCLKVKLNAIGTYMDHAFYQTSSDFRNMRVKYNLQGYDDWENAGIFHSMEISRMPRPKTFGSRRN